MEEKKKDRQLGESMKHVYGLLLIAWIAIGEILKFNIDLLSIASLLGILCLFILKEKFFDKKYASILFFLLILILSQYVNREFILLACIPIFDLFYFKKIPIGTIGIIIAFVWFSQGGNYYDGIHFFLAALLGYILGAKENNEKYHNFVLDEERRLRYRLEEAQNELINSRKEIEHLTEIRERNRIAHEIHDNIGHSIAGVIFQIEGAKRIIHKDKEKLESILKLCSSKLSEALELTRNTVYNIKTDRKIGLDSLEKIVNDFRFCPIHFEYSGDFNRVSAVNMSILEANLREALTNASKYSKAQNIHIKIDIGKMHIRFYYKDNGIGCSNIHESLGISGMRDRIKNVSGTIAVDGNNGFMIVCHIPMKSGEVGE